MTDEVDNITKEDVIKLTTEVTNSINNISDNYLFESTSSVYDSVVKYINSTYKSGGLYDYEIMCDLHDYYNITKKTKLSREEFDNLSSTEQQSIEYLFKISNPNQGLLNICIKIPVSIPMIHVDLKFSNTSMKFNLRESS
jgi:hypothetical protein